MYVSRADILHGFYLICITMWSLLYVGFDTYLHLYISQWFHTIIQGSGGYIRFSNGLIDAGIIVPFCSIFMSS